MATCDACGEKLELLGGKRCATCHAAFCGDCSHDTGRMIKNGGIKYMCYSCKPDTKRAAVKEKPVKAPIYSDIPPPSVYLSQLPEVSRPPPEPEPQWQPPPPEDPRRPRLGLMKGRGKPKQDYDALRDLVTLLVPNFIEMGATSEIVVKLRNPPDGSIVDIRVDFSDLQNFFEVEGTVEIPVLRPGMKLRKSVRVRPKHEEGIFPVKILIVSRGGTAEEEHTIKVGGTEIY